MQNDGDQALQPSAVNVQPLPHGHVLDAFFHPVRLFSYLYRSVLVDEFLPESKVLLPVALEIRLGVDHDETLPRGGVVSCLAAQVGKFHGCGRGRLIDGLGVLCGIVGGSVDEQLGEAELTIGRENSLTYGSVGCFFLEAVFVPAGGCASGCLSALSRYLFGPCGAGISRTVPTGRRAAEALALLVSSSLVVEPSARMCLGGKLAVDATEAYTTQCQLRASSSSNSASRGTPWSP
jgi:hypothetical protein